ncbi:MAG: hypothetical protein HFE90_06705 [Firmicutes bacterium]|nr:hypothetical protein [Bacillota bacterium]
MSENQKRETTTNVLFEKTVCEAPKNIRTQYEDKPVEYWTEVEDCIFDMFEDEDQFITLTVANARHNIRFVQACRISGGINVQIGVEDEKNTKLFEKTCTEDECLDIFKEFYNSSYIHDVEKYSPVEFFI